MNDPADELIASWRNFFAGSDPDTGLPFEIEDEMADQAFAAMQAALTGSAMSPEAGMPLGQPGGTAFAAMAHGPHAADIRELMERVALVAERIERIESALGTLLDKVATPDGTAADAAKPKPASRRARKRRDAGKRRKRGRK